MWQQSNAILVGQGVVIVSDFGIVAEKYAFDRRGPAWRRGSLRRQPILDCGRNVSEAQYRHARPVGRLLLLASHICAQPLVTRRNRCIADFGPYDYTGVRLLFGYVAPTIR